MAQPVAKSMKKTRMVGKVNRVRARFELGHGFAIIVCCVIGMGCWRPVVAQSGKTKIPQVQRTPVVGLSDQDPTEAKIDQLVAKLGAESYQDRLGAEKELIQVGPKAAERLQAYLDSSGPNTDLEIRLRAKRLIVQILKEDLDSRIRLFLDAESSEAEHDLPGWRQFALIVGDDSETREMFVQMYRYSPPMFESLKLGKGSFELEFRKRATPAVRVRQNGAKTLDALCSLMFLAEYQFKPSGASIRLESTLVVAILERLLQPSTVAFVRSCRFRDQVESLLGHWLERRVVQNLGWLNLRIEVAEAYRLPSQISFLGAQVADTGVPLATRIKALEVLGKIGSSKDCQILSPALQDRQKISRLLVRRNKLDVEVEFRDLVLITCLKLSKLDPKEFGLRITADISNPKEPVCSFASDSDRNQAFQRWAEYQNDLLESESKNNSTATPLK